MPKHAAPQSSGSSARRSEQKSQDEHIGLTEAFAPVPAEKNTPVSASPSLSDHDDENTFSPISAIASDKAPSHASSLSAKGDKDAGCPDALESLEARSVSEAPFDQKPAHPGDAPSHGRHLKKERTALPPHLRKSRRMRRLLIAIIALLVVLIGVLGYFTFDLINRSSRLASQQTQQNSSADSLENDDAKDASSETAKKTEAPDLVSLLGVSQEDATAALKRGAQVTLSKDVNEEGNPIKKNITIALTDEPADTRSGTPTVYLGLDEGGKTIQAGYSAPTASLGFGSLSFVDAVKNEHIVEKTLKEAGVNVPEGTATLPDDKSAYSTYASDGVALTQQTYSFSGSLDFGGSSHEWSSVLTYNYTTANISGNLADTIRIIYIYINA